MVTHQMKKRELRPKHFSSYNTMRRKFKVASFLRPFVLVRQMGKGMFITAPPYLKDLRES